MPLFRRSKKIKRIITEKLKDKRDELVRNLNAEVKGKLASLTEEQLVIEQNNIEFQRKIRIREIVRELMIQKENLAKWIDNESIVDIYKEFINKSRPIPKYEQDYPTELLKELKEPHVLGWVHWYFTFYDTAALTKEDIQEKIDATPIGTKMYKNKIQGLRGRATGLVFSNFERARHIKTKEWAMQFLNSDRKSERFVQFTAGLDTAYSQKSPDTIVMTFFGITNKGKCIQLDERVYNNAEIQTPIAPSDTVRNFIDFLDRNREEWGFARTAFIDNADQATITEFQKYKRQNGCIYGFANAWKKTKIIDRINLVLGWLATDCYFVLEHCKNTIAEFEIYSWREDKDNTPEDGHDHCINSGQYAWLPFKNIIGSEINGADKQNG